MNVKYISLFLFSVEFVIRWRDAAGVYKMQVGMTIQLTNNVVTSWRLVHLGKLENKNVICFPSNGRAAIF